jgi:subtilisin family serine protease
MARRLFGALLLGVLGCGGAGGATTAAPAPAAPPAPAVPARPEPRPVLPPSEAYARGWMPLAATGIPRFLADHPTYDGRGVLIAILDSGIDPGIPGLELTTTGERKILDLRDFSGEGAVRLEPVEAHGDLIRVGSQVLAGASRLRTLMVGDRLWAGTLAERPLGELPASDLNGDWDDADTLAVVVARASDGWVLFADTDGDGTLADERPVHDYLVGRESFAWRHRGRAATINLAANFRETGAAPRLDLFFDTSAHGSHVAGIAAAHDMYGVKGFNGVAPGAFLLGVKIANNAHGGISTTGSMLEGIAYALRFAAERRLPLVLNMSFGVGNETEGRARIDRAIDSILALHPEVVFAISAGNDGPGLSTMGFPGSAARALTVGATLPGVFLGATGQREDPIAYFSSRGGELAKPEIVTPGMAYSTVPRWSTGEERLGGTSMASPHAAGLVALLVSGLVQEQKPVRALAIRHALAVTARPLPGQTVLDAGTGVPDVGAAWRWLATGRTVPDVRVATHDGQTAGWIVRSPRLAGDTVQRFRISLPDGAGPLPLSLRSNAPWLVVPGQVTLAGGVTEVAAQVKGGSFKPGVHTGVVTGWTADSLLGPVVRLVTTVVVPDTGSLVIADLGRLAPGAEGRHFFRAEKNRPFAVGFTTSGPGEMLLAYLHEPGGQPYREDNGIGAGYGEQAGVYTVDGRDVVPGLYEAVGVASPLEAARGSITVVQSPVTLEAGRTMAGVEVRLENRTDEPVETAPFAVVVGAERHEAMGGTGSGPGKLKVRLPPWAVHATIDVQMDREAWPEFTDFGVSLVDNAGRILGKSPMNYAFGRLHVDLVSVPRDSVTEAEVRLLPGFAAPDTGQAWTATVSVRLYADSAGVRPLMGEQVTVPPKGGASLTLPYDGTALPAGPGFVPLGIVVVPEGDNTWTLEVPLPAPGTPLTP